MNRRRFLKRARAVPFLWPGLLLWSGLRSLVQPLTASAQDILDPPEVPMLKPLVDRGLLPPVGARLPKHPRVSDFASFGRTLGRYGGEVRTLVASARDLRYIAVSSYARLVGYDQNLDLKPDILERVTVEDDRIFTFALRPGMRWSDGAPFTTEDFRYYWEDVALDKALHPTGPPDLLLVDGEHPEVTILDDIHVRYSWSKPNPGFLPAIAKPRPVFIYAPAHYLKQFHLRYKDKSTLAAVAAEHNFRSWATLHTRMDDPRNETNPDMPTLDPWVIKTRAPAARFILERNPYFYRVDPEGRQLPYIDRIVATVAAQGLFTAKANAGEVDLLNRGLSMGDIPVLKEGETDHDYRTLLWPKAEGSAFALYPNLTTSDAIWRTVLRDVRFRRALSLAIDRHTLNNALWFGLGTASNNTVLKHSKLYSEADRSAWTNHDQTTANRLLDDMGLKRPRESQGIRRLPDGRPLMIVVEVNGNAKTLIDALQITAEFWADVGVQLFVKPQDIGNLRQRLFAGQTLMVATTGLDNAIPTAVMSPEELAPVHQSNGAWPKWGQYYETGGQKGEAPDLPGATRLMALYDEWQDTDDFTIKTRVWREMLDLHAQNQWIIGTVTGDLQPIVISKRLRNVPERAYYSWEPTALLGAYRVDAFYFAETEQ